MKSLPFALESIHRHFHRRELVSPDPLEVLYDYEVLADREIAALLASCLAYGQVKAIVSSVRTVLRVMGSSPSRFLDRATDRELRESLDGFAYRWTRAEHLVGLLRAVRRARAEYGTLEGLMSASDGVPLEKITRWVQWLRNATSCRGAAHLLPSPSDGSTCKRLHLFLRWMVRQDAIDPGGWTCLAPADLLVPVDVHMHRVGRALGFTRANTPSMKVVIEVTAGFRKIVPEDPVRYDFALTRLGIRQRATRPGPRKLREAILSFQPV